MFVGDDEESLAETREIIREQARARVAAGKPVRFIDAFSPWERRRVLFFLGGATTCVALLAWLHARI